MKTNIIPDCVDIGVDVRTLPGERHDDVTAHLRAALGDLFDKVEIEVIMDDPASISRTDNPLWNSLERALAKPFPTGSTDTADRGRVLRRADLSKPGFDRVRGRVCSVPTSIPPSSVAASTATTNASMSSRCA